MKEIQRDNVSHTPTKEKTSMKELRRFRAEVRKGMEMERKGMVSWRGKLGSDASSGELAASLSTLQLGQASMRSSTGWIDPVPLSRGTLSFHSYIQHYKNQQSCPSWAKGNPLDWKVVDIIGVFLLCSGNKAHIAKLSDIPNCCKQQHGTSTTGSRQSI